MTELGKYEIIEEIGRGGFAVVYKARDTTLNRVVALKVLHPQLTTDPKFVQRFQQEAQTAARLRHPHIVTIYEVDEEGGQHYLAMSYLPGHTLDERLSATKGPLPVELAISIVEQIADALDTIHQQGLVHRDVKPANVMVDSKGQATLLDFGIVRAAEGTRLTTTMAVLGTPEYMAPEQAELQEGIDIDWRADIYALGVVTYEMLVGRPPFTGRSPTAVLYKHVHEPPPEPTTLNPNLPARLEPVLLKALAKGQEERFQRAGDFAATLRRALLTDSQILQREAQLAPLYRQLQAAAARGNWRGVLVLGSQIQALDASYRDVSQRMAHARQQLRTPAEPAPAQPMPRERAEEPERKARRTPALNWRAAGLSALVALGCISLIAVALFCGPLRPCPPSPTETPTPTGTVSPKPTLTYTPTPTPTSTPTGEPPTEEPWVTIKLDDGCGREYGSGDETRLYVQAGVEGTVEVWLDGETFIAKASLTPEEVWETDWAFKDTETGEHEFTASLMEPEGIVLARASCAFSLAHEKEACTPDATFVAHVTVPDGTKLDPGEPFDKTWRVLNSGTCDWEAGTLLVFVSGDLMGGPGPVAVEAVGVGAVEVGATPDVSVNLVAPTEPGAYAGNWQLQAPDGTNFGPVLHAKIVVPLSGTWRTFTTTHGLADRIVRAIAVGRDDALWFGTVSGVSRYDLDADTWETFTTKDGLVHNVVEAVAVGPDGTLWFGTVGGVSRYDPDAGTWDTFTTSDGLIDDDVHAVAVGPDAALWFGTASGVSRYDPSTSTWDTFTTSDGLIDDDVHAVAVGPDAALWFGTAGGASRHDPNTGIWQTFTPADGFGFSARNIAVGPDGVLWFGSYRRGVSRYDPNTTNWQIFTTEDGLANNEVFALAVRPDGTLWVGVSASVSRYDPASDFWQTFTPADGLGGGAVEAVAVGPEGNLWFGTEFGVSRFEPTNP